MRKVVAICGASAALAAVATGSVVYWRRNPRIGTRFVNAVVNPRLLGGGLAGGAKSELGTIEQFGRKSGIRRLTPVHPEPTRDGFRIVVPLGEHSEWARNVVAAGHCRLQLHEHVYELDEPTMIPASDASDLPRVVRAVMGALGFRYLVLRTFSVNPGVLEPTGTQPETAAPSEPPQPVPQEASI
ncbi:MAG TPA: nitroreductase/quinone reductase family protein [Candidatus Limnocylindrales bacterium]